MNYDEKFLLGFIKELTGIDYSKSDQIQIAKRLKEVKVLLSKRESSLSLFIEDPYQSEETLLEVINVFTNNETAFFRDKRPYELLKHLSSINELPKSFLKILSLPCSTGQEAYSLLFLMLEAGYLKNQFMVDALDIDTQALDKAQSGIYNKFEVMRGLSVDHKNNYFDKYENGLRVRKEYRKLVRFLRFNLLSDELEEGKYNIIFLRNVLFYFDDETKKSVLSRISQSLAPKGVIVLGNGENVDVPELIENKFEGMIYYTKS